MQHWGFVTVLFADQSGVIANQSGDVDLGASTNVTAFAMINGAAIEGPVNFSAGITTADNEDLWGGGLVFPVNPLFQGDAQNLTFWVAAEEFTPGQSGVTATLVILSN